MKLAAFVSSLMLLLAGSAWAQPATQPTAIGAQLQAAQLDVDLASARLALVQAQAGLAAGQPAQARVHLNNAQQLLASIQGQTDVTAYRQVADRLAVAIDKAEDAQRRLAQAPPAPAEGPVVVVGQPAQDCLMPGEVCKCQHAKDEPCSCKRCPPVPMPNVVGQSQLAANQVDLAREHGLTNVPGSRTYLANDPAVILQRTLDHQRRWDEGRYTPARELVDVGAMLELDQERLNYQATLNAVRDGAHRDELLHVVEATIPPPYVMNYPQDWECIEQARAKYADGKLWESAPFKDSDGKTKTVAVYDVSDLLFVPIFPGPSEYNVTRPIDPVRYWARQERMSELFTHPQPILGYGGYGYGYGYGYGGYPYFAPPPVVIPGNGAATAPVNGNGGVPGSYYGVGGYYGYRVTDVIGTASYYPFEADPIYQYRLAQKRASLLQAVSQMMSVPQD